MAGIFYVYLPRLQYRHAIMNMIKIIRCRAFLVLGGIMPHLAGETLSAATVLAAVAVFALLVVAVSTTAAFGIMLIGKLGVRDRVIMLAPKLISELFSCDFCLSWWTCLLLSALLAVIFGLWYILIVAFIATPLTRRLIA